MRTHAERGGRLGRRSRPPPTKRESELLLLSFWGLAVVVVDLQGLFIGTVVVVVRVGRVLAKD